MNVDLTFTGVVSVQLDTYFTLKSLDWTPVSGSRPPLTTYVLSHPGGIGLVVGEEMAYDENVKGLFEALPSAGARTYRAHMLLETEVMFALRTMLPDAEIRTPDSPDTGVDIEIRFAERTAYVEVVWANEKSAASQAKKRLDRLRSLNLPGPLILVVGGEQRSEISLRLQDQWHALARNNPAAVEIVAWDHLGQQTFATAVARALDLR